LSFVLKEDIIDWAAEKAGEDGESAA